VPLAHPSTPGWVDVNPPPVPPYLPLILRNLCSNLCSNLFRSYARGVAASLHAAAVLSVVPKSAVAFPQSWRSPGWPCGDGDGVLVQLEAAAVGGTRQKLLKLWFVPVDVAARTVAAPWSGLDPTTFAVLPSLLR